MAVSEKDFNDLVDVVNDLAEKVEDLRTQRNDDVTGDDDIDIREWVKQQIALAGGYYKVESSEPSEGK
jgi:hypothetical protein